MSSSHRFFASDLTLPGLEVPVARRQLSFVVVAEKDEAEPLGFSAVPNLASPSTDLDREVAAAAASCISPSSQYESGLSPSVSSCSSSSLISPSTSLRSPDSSLGSPDSTSYARYSVNFPELASATSSRISSPVAAAAAPAKKNRVQQRQKPRGLAAQIITRNFAGEHSDNYQQFYNFLKGSSWVQTIKEEFNKSRSASEEVPQVAAAAAVLPQATLQSVDESKEPTSPTQEERLSIQPAEQLIERGRALLGPHISLNTDPYYVVYAGKKDERPALALSTELLKVFFSDQVNLSSVENALEKKRILLAKESQTQEDYIANFLKWAEKSKLNARTHKANYNKKTIGLTRKEILKKALSSIREDIDQLLVYLSQAESFSQRKLLQIAGPKLSALLEACQKKFDATEGVSLEVQNELVGFFEEWYKEINGSFSLIEKCVAAVKISKKSSESVQPACLSVAVFASGQGVGCWLMLSNPELYTELFAQLLNFIQQYENKDGVRISLLKAASEDSQTVLQLALQVLGHSHPALPYRPCSEKSLISLAIKETFADPQFQLIDVVNLSFYPHKAEERERLLAQGTANQSKLLSIPLRDNERLLEEIPCCPHCQQNKAGFLALLGAAREYKMQLDKQQKNVVLSLQESTRAFLASQLNSGNQAVARASASLNPAGEKMNSLVTSPPEKSIAVRSRPSERVTRCLFGAPRVSDEAAAEAPTQAANFIRSSSDSTPERVTEPSTNLLSRG